MAKSLNFLFFLYFHRVLLHIQVNSNEKIFSLSRAASILVKLLEMVQFFRLTILILLVTKFRSLVLNMLSDLYFKRYRIF